MSIVSDLVKSVVDSALGEILKKTGVRKRRRRRTSTATSTIRQIEKLLKPAKRQTSRKKTVRSRSKTRRRAY
ncbi:MAG: hypothetical protein M9955_25710 [Rhizobiaceae bacterium]|nr:hypothetical protein [Rhizobiaceae bacterium]